ncbi:nicotinate (nicotinamide) nucleotide adenylyltransferase [Desulfobacter vibrioformis]|uniref:nicotinate (nicotinamide) nucleotide adenylyltransferase n=1 Tax=Desulfobacter vibrioformis TaxID=34031 RepID=UPI00054FE6E4|nr:nicotinate (nicotinamide) nucleotide adenylyltransferase [Desulfobacter vibrioformis]
MNAGLFGGTFNPIHNGHLGIIKYVKAQCAFDTIIIYPSALPPHKSNHNLASAQDRLAMVKGAVKHLNGFQVSDIELQRQGPSFTIDTISQFKTIFGKDARFHLLLGSDAFFDTPSWKQARQIFGALPVIVMQRGEKTGMAPFASFIDEHVAKGYKLKNDNLFVHDRLFAIRICNVPRIDISSTQIRNRIKSGKSISGLVPEYVETFIRTKDLYK